MTGRIEQVINRLRPAVQQDGGDIQLVDVSNGIATLRLSGSAAKSGTLRQGIERAIRAELPEIQGIDIVDS